MLRAVAAVIIGIIADALLSVYTDLPGLVCFLGGVLAAIVAWYTLPFDRRV